MLVWGHRNPRKSTKSSLTDSNNATIRLFPDIGASSDSTIFDRGSMPIRVVLPPLKGISCSTGLPLFLDPSGSR